MKKIIIGLILILVASSLFFTREAFSDILQESYTSIKEVVVGKIALSKENDEEIVSAPETQTAGEQTEVAPEDVKPAIDPNDPFLLLVNKEVGVLDETYVPQNLAVPNVAFSTSVAERKQMVKEAADALEQLFAAASNDGITLHAQSGYRSFGTQEYLYDSYVRANGEEAASTFSAKPGQSEHQTGLAMDVTSDSVDNQLVQEYGETVEGKWLAEHAEEYGFIIRFQLGKEDITGYMYEPWHLRYVGVEHAKYMTEHGLTLEEYLGVTEK
ncbi:M15 family metallopeptidase [Bacillus sp. REN16]|uniref:M15 family metallopeptidase n=1 Tax=Bacillus sp. REN16 TaxID=2887296 RepID=UPI001E4702E0|nr:M15 family metallopeptidase [Bacillus sp. REN16]MCC3357724.1 M15 family metallopeptidase [Bacillus sp. REN16]